MRRTAAEWQRALAKQFEDARGDRTLQSVAEEVAKRRPLRKGRTAESKVGVQTVWRLESGENVTTDIIDAVAKALGVRVDVRLVPESDKPGDILPSHPSRDVEETSVEDPELQTLRGLLASARRHNLHQAFVDQVEVVYNDLLRAHRAKSKNE